MKIGLETTLRHKFVIGILLQIICDKGLGDDAASIPIALTLMPPRSNTGSLAKPFPMFIEVGVRFVDLQDRHLSAIRNETPFFSNF